jgi:hypothetical protein
MLNFKFSILNCGTSLIKDRTTIQHSKFSIQNYPLRMAFLGALHVLRGEPFGCFKFLNGLATGV